MGGPGTYESEGIQHNCKMSRVQSKLKSNCFEVESNGRNVNQAIDRSVGRSVIAAEDL